MKNLMMIIVLAMIISMTITTAIQAYVVNTDNFDAEKAVLKVYTDEATLFGISENTGTHTDEMIGAFFLKFTDLTASADNYVFENERNSDILKTGDMTALSFQGIKGDIGTGNNTSGDFKGEFTFMTNLDCIGDAATGVRNATGLFHRDSTDTFKVFGITDYAEFMGTCNNVDKTGGFAFQKCPVDNAEAIDSTFSAYDFIKDSDSDLRIASFDGNADLEKAGTFEENTSHTTETRNVVCATGLFHDGLNDDSNDAEDFDHISNFYC